MATITLLFWLNRNLRWVYLCFRSGYKPGSVTVFVLNLDDADITVSFPSLKATYLLHLYSMQPADGALKSQ